MKLTSTQPLIDVEMVQSEAYWRKLCPKLQLSNGWVNPASEQAGQELLTKKEEQDLRARLDADGYCTLSAAQVGCTAKAASHLAAGVSLLKENGWPPTFILMFDEALELTAKAAAVAQAVTGNRPLMDIQASHVAPDAGQGGFPPHRDRPFGDKEATAAPASFRPVSKHKLSNMPKFCTVWIALSKCTPDNGCLYVVPKAHDHGYQVGDSLSLEGPTAVAASMWGLRQSPTGAAIWSPNTNEALSAVRAIPLEPGEAVIISHRILHWGSKGRIGSTHGPRVSLTCSCADKSFEAAFLQDCFSPSLAMRGSLAAAQSLSYEDQAKNSMSIPPERRKLYLLLCRLGLEGFGEGYRERIQRIFAEFEDLESESESDFDDAPIVGDEEGTLDGGAPDEGRRSRANSNASRDSLVREMHKRKWNAEEGQEGWPSEVEEEDQRGEGGEGGAW